MEPWYWCKQETIRVKGKIRIFLKNGGYQFISNVCYVPKIKNNILRMNQLLEKSYYVHMRDNRFL